MIFESLDVMFPRDWPERAKVEQLIFAPEIRKLVLSEEPERMGRCEGLNERMKLMEEKVTVTCRSKDASLVKSITEAASKQYTEKSNRKTQIEVREGLSDDQCHGGVTLAGHNGRIKIDQTLDERLRLLEDKMLQKTWLKH